MRTDVASGLMVALSLLGCEPGPGSALDAPDAVDGGRPIDAASLLDEGGLDAHHDDAGTTADTGTPGTCDVPASSSVPVDADFDHVVVLDRDHDAASFDALVGALSPGTVLVRPAAGVCPTIRWGEDIVGSHELPRTDITFFAITMIGALGITDGTTLWSVRGDPFVFNSSGDGVTIRDSYLSGGAGTPQDEGCIGNRYHQNTLSNADGWLVEGNTFANYANREEACADDHSEALYLGERTTNWVIRGNTFDNNGSTGHIFFTWWYCDGGHAPECDPVNVCVEQNTFTNVINEFGTDIQARGEFDGSQSVYIDPAQDAGGNAPSDWIRPCP